MYSHYVFIVIAEHYIISVISSLYKLLMEYDKILNSGENTLQFKGVVFIGHPWTLHPELSSGLGSNLTNTT